MWWTPLGDRVLRGAEWDLFREGLDTLWDWVEDSTGDPGLDDTGADAFDRLQVGQKLALLALIGRALSDEGMPHPDLTVNTESAVAAVFNMIANEVSVEIDLSGEPESVANLDSPEDATHWRRLVLVAYRESQLQDEAEAMADFKGEARNQSDASHDDEEEDESDEAWSLPEATSEEEEDWEFLVYCLANRILWEDGDHEVADDFLDADPDQARVRMQMMGIAEDYYTDIAPDPTDEQLEPIRRTLRSLCGRPEPEEQGLIAGIRDSYHGLHVGPCDPGTIASEVACPLVEEIGVIGEGEFDCAHAEWAELFRGEVHRVASTQSTGMIYPEVVLSEEQKDAVAQSHESGKPLVLDDNHRVEPRDGGWIVVNPYGFILVNVEECEWVHRDGIPDIPTLKFPGAAEALIGCLRAEIIAVTQSERYEAALKKLGRE